MHTVIVGHRISDINAEMGNSKWRKEVAQKPSLGTHLHDIILSVRSAGLWPKRTEYSSDQLGKTESMTKP